MQERNRNTPLAPESTVTDQNGQYIFNDIKENSLRLRVEREHLETKEATVHRSHPTTLADGTVSDHNNDPQNTPGTILIEQRWPDAVRPLLQQVQFPRDPLFIVVNPYRQYAGTYNSGVVQIAKDMYDRGAASVIHVLAHEIAHMWQDVAIQSYFISWVDAPAGIAFTTARQKDWDTVGKAQIDHIPHFRDSLENAAEVCAYYWAGINGSLHVYGDLRVTAPNRYQWAERWLGR